MADSEHVIASLRAMAAAAGTSLGFDREAWSVALAPLLRAWERLIGAHPELRERTTGAVGAASTAPVDAFVDLERARGQVAVEEVDRSLSTLTRVLAGSELLTPATFAAGKLLMEGAVPPSWEKHWEGPEEPVAYCKAVVARMLAVNAMLDRRRDPGGLLSRPARLDSFFHPETFLNALRQQSAREARVAIDSLALVTAWDPDDGIVRGGCVVEGLRLQGAVLNSGRLEEPMPDAPPFQTLPQCAWRGCRRDAPAPRPRGGMGETRAARATVPHGDAREGDRGGAAARPRRRGGRQVGVGGRGVLRRSGLKIG